MTKHLLLVFFTITNVILIMSGFFIPAWTENVINNSRPSNSSSAGFIRISINPQIVLTPSDTVCVSTDNRIEGRNERDSSLFAVTFFLLLVCFGVGWFLFFRWNNKLIYQSREESIVKDVKLHLNFLLNHGYRISDVHYADHPMGGWSIRLESSDGVLAIFLDQQIKPRLAFGTNKDDEKQQILVDEIVYFLSEGKTFVGDSYYHKYDKQSEYLMKFGEFLELHINQIEEFVRKDPVKAKKQVQTIQDQYRDLCIEEKLIQYQKKKRKTA